MKKILIWSGIVFLVLIAVMMIFAVLGLKETTDLTIEAVDLSQIPDGSYTGKYDNFRFSNTVEVVVKDHQIIEIQPVKTADGREKLNEELIENILEQQRNDIDAVSGATASSNGFLKAVEIALENAS
jgi:uncharacterized protein with FMN-binding domain